MAEHDLLSITFFLQVSRKGSHVGRVSEVGGGLTLIDSEKH